MHEYSRKAPPKIQKHGSPNSFQIGIGHVTRIGAIVQAGVRNGRRKLSYPPDSIEKRLNDRINVAEGRRKRKQKQALGHPLSQIVQKLVKSGSGRTTF